MVRGYLFRFQEDMLPTDEPLSVLAYAKEGFLMTRLIFLNWGVLHRRTFFSLNFALKHRIVSTHIRNYHLHCSQLLSELLVFELNCLCNESDNSISNAKYLNIINYMCCYVCC